MDFPQPVSLLTHIHKIANKAFESYKIKNPMAGMNEDNWILFQIYRGVHVVFQLPFPVGDLVWRLKSEKTIMT